MFRRAIIGMILVACLSISAPTIVLAGTNVSNLIGIGAISRSMGGVGIAAPQDAISAVYANPAAMCFGEYCPDSEFDFGISLLMPHTSVEVEGPGVLGKLDADGEDHVYPAPAIGLSIPLTKSMPLWRFGLGAYGLSGFGEDLKGTSLDNPNYFAPGVPAISGEYTNMQTMKFSPAIAFQPCDIFSIGAAFHVAYESLDLRQGTSYGWGYGGQVGVIYKPLERVSLGLTYLSPTSVTHDNVMDLDSDGFLDDVEMESPQQIGFGVASRFFDNRLLLEADVKWMNWSSAEGYGDIGFDDQWVFAFGMQYKPIPKLALRAGYNYGKNPLEEHNGFVGTDKTSFQGKELYTYYFETLRSIGVPLILEHHMTFGIGYQITPRVLMDVGYEHSFESTFRESGTSIIGQPVSITSDVSADVVDLALRFRF